MKKIFSLFVAMLFSVVMFADDVYSVVGDDLPNGWDEKSTVTNMTLTDGVYTYVWENAQLSAGNHSYKIVKNHSWVVSYPQSGNASFNVEKDGKYNVTFALDLSKETKQSATPELVEETEITHTATLMGLADADPWGAGDAMANADGNLTASVTKHFTPSADSHPDTLGFKIKLDGTLWRSNNYNYHRGFTGTTNITDNTSGNMFVIVDVEGDYTFTWTYATNALEITFPALPDPSYFLAGSFSNWYDEKVAMVNNEGVWSASVSLEADSLYQYQIVKKQATYVTWFGAQDESNLMEYGNSTDWTLSSDPRYNIYLKTTNATSYTFQYTPESYKMTVVIPAKIPTAIDEVEGAVKTVKRVVNGQLVIEREGKFYNALGAEVK